MAVISFENYVIDESYYKVNDNFDYSQDELNMPVTFSAEVGVDKNQEKAYVYGRTPTKNSGNTKF
mgnify:CR=1 FL=1